MLTSYCNFAYSVLKSFRVVTFVSALIFTMASCESSQPVDSTQETVVTEDVPLVDLDQEMDTYRSWFSALSAEEKDTLMTDLATFITRKPATAQNATSKFDPMYRSYYVKKREELEFVCAQKIEGKLFFYLLREARDAKGVRQRGVGGVFEFGDKGRIINFEELFNTRILEKDELERIGLGFMKVAKDANLLNDFIADQSIIEWPDGRLFYSKEKNEWRYVE
jgi:hypothetical protein